MYLNFCVCRSQICSVESALLTSVFSAKMSDIVYSLTYTNRHEKRLSNTVTHSFPFFSSGHNHISCTHTRTLYAVGEVDR